jgi:hypothetical protein
MNETEIKYLAGLLDADGHIGFAYGQNRVRLEITLNAADSIDQKGYVLALPALTGFGSSCTKSKRVATWGQVHQWRVASRRDINMLVPRLLKHMVIRGRHLERMYDQWLHYDGHVVDEMTKNQLKEFVAASRRGTGPVKAKKHPTWAWTAGYLDGDGSFIYKKAPSQKSPRMLVQATCHEMDRPGIDLLHKAFGGNIYNRGKHGTHILDWRHALGIKNQQFAEHFLSKIVQHSKLKKHKIEQLLAHVHSRTRTD